jgi:hypothetical protein
MMRAVALAATVPAGCATAARPAAPSGDGLCSPALRLSLKVKPRPAGWAGRGPIVAARLENSGPTPIRLRTGAHFRFEIRDSTGRESRYGGSAPNVHLGPTSYFVLAAGASVDDGAGQDLSIHYRLEPGHEYTVRGQLIDRYGYPIFGPPAPGVCVVSSPAIVVHGPVAEDPGPP